MRRISSRTERPSILRNRFSSVRRDNPDDRATSSTVTPRRARSRMSRNALVRCGSSAAKKSVERRATTCEASAMIREGTACGLAHQSVQRVRRLITGTLEINGDARHRRIGQSANDFIVVGADETHQVRHRQSRQFADFHHTLAAIVIAGHHAHRLGQRLQPVGQRMPFFRPILAGCGQA